MIKKNLSEISALIYAPLPPPIGGIASIVDMLHRGIGERNDISFITPISKGRGFYADAARPTRNILRLIQAVGSIKRKGRILFFSSARGSFFEKLFWALLVILRGRKAVVVMVDGNFPPFWDSCSQMLRNFFSWVVNNSNFELGAQSEEWRSYYQSIFPLARIKVVGATVAEEFFDHIRQPDTTLRKVTILYVGWIIHQKGMIDLLDAATLLCKTHPEAKFRLVGPLFGKEEYWNNEITNRGISSQVEFLGSFSDRKSLINEFDTASIFVFPSHFEGFPVALLEAITMGLACVGTSIGGIPDILDHGRAGIVIPPHSPTELANALKYLLDKPDEVEKLSKHASIRARTVYSHATCMESYMQLMGIK